MEPEELLGLIIGLGLGLPLAAVVLFIIVVACRRYRRRYRKRRLGLDQVALPRDQKVVALTIDCGPSDETGKILDLLKGHGAKATFFVTGGAEIVEHMEMLHRIHDEGHELGIHPLGFEGIGSMEEPNLAELQEYIRAVEELLPANPGGAKYLRRTAAIGSRKNKKANQLIMKLGYLFVKREILAVVLPARIQAGMIIPIIGREDEIRERTEEMLNRFTEERWEVETVGGLLMVGKKQVEQTQRARTGVEPGFNQMNGTSGAWRIANWN
jgi:hypothetical protein